MSFMQPLSLTMGPLATALVPASSKIYFLEQLDSVESNGRTFLALKACLHQDSISKFQVV